MRPARFLKNLVVPSGYRQRTILTGPFSGIRMCLDLRTQSQIYVGLFERELHPWVTRFSKGIRSVVDIGAAHGEYTLYALLKTSAERGIAFEPDRNVIEHLNRNLRSNGLEKSRKLDLHTTFLGSNNGPDRISVD